MTGFADHFSRHAALYAARRPGYPSALFDWLAGQCTRRERAWDAGCGSGQATVALADRFVEVIGTDPSAEQIAQALPHRGVSYRVEAAEQASLADASADLVLVAQALHWFDQRAFHAQVRRVLRPGGVFAACTYGLCQVDAAVDRRFLHLYHAVLGPYWPAERRHVESGYRSLPFPYAPLQAPAFTLVQAWSLPAYLGYLQSWSATQRCLKATGADPVEAMAEDFRAAWGDPEQVRMVRFPLSLRVGRRRH